MVVCALLLLPPLLLFHLHKFYQPACYFCHTLPNFIEWNVKNFLRSFSVFFFSSLIIVLILLPKKINKIKFIHSVVIGWAWLRRWLFCALAYIHANTSELELELPVTNETGEEEEEGGVEEEEENDKKLPLTTPHRSRCSSGGGSNSSLELEIENPLMRLQMLLMVIMTLPLQT